MSLKVLLFSPPPSIFKYIQHKTQKVSKHRSIESHVYADNISQCCFHEIISKFLMDLILEKVFGQINYNHVAIVVKVTGDDAETHSDNNEHDGCVS